MYGTGSAVMDLDGSISGYGLDGRFVCGERGT
jgi:hypothetical protein